MSAYRLLHPVSIYNNNNKSLYEHQQQQQQHHHYGVSSPTILIADKVLTHQALFYPYISDTQLQTIALSSTHLSQYHSPTMLRCSVDNIAMPTDDSYVNVVVNIIIIINITIIINIVIINATIMIINEINTITVSALLPTLSTSLLMITEVRSPRRGRNVFTADETS